MSNPAQIIAPIVNLLRCPDGPRDRQVLFGDTVQVIETKDGWARIVADKDGYTGYVESQSLGTVTPSTHWISAPSTHVYADANMKSPDLMTLSFGSRIAVISQTDGFVQTSAGYIPLPHVRHISALFSDPLKVAQKLVGTPYLWGGNSRFGIDCSGLVQASYLACGLACPGDSSMQIDAFGAGLPNDPTPQPNDLLFFKGHVAMVVDQNTLLHANAFDMAVSFEPLVSALERIESQGDGQVIRHIRPSLL